MEYRVLARKYRPQSFSDLLGQETLVKTLTNALAQGRLAHAFILTGVRGVGKTTTARIIAKGLNCIGTDGNGSATIEPCGVCENCTAIIEDRHVDVMEMDAASRTGVDDIREIIDGVRYKPVVARNKVYIIDEVHMLSRNAFNALLKTLEEPPENVTFIFATTEIRKVPVTVISRCQRFDLKRLNAEDLVSLFSKVCEQETVDIEKEALAAIARAADGSARDGLSLLDQGMALSAGVITALRVREMLGISDKVDIFELFEKVMIGDVPKALTQLARMSDSGVDPLAILQDLLETVHLVTKCKVYPDMLDDTVSDFEKQKSLDFARRLSMAQLGRCWQMLLKGNLEVQNAFAPLAALEMLIIRLVHLADTAVLEQEEKKKFEVTEEILAPCDNEQADLEPGALISNELSKDNPPSSFIELVELFEQKKEGILHAQLVETVRPVRIAPGVLDIEAVEGLDETFPARMAKLLIDWTGIPWDISLVNSKGEKTLSEKKMDWDNEAKKSAIADPLVAAVLKSFPGAEVQSVKQLTRGDNN